MKKTRNSDQLAILGGTPIRNKPWPKWPVSDKNTERVLIDVLHSGRWGIDGPYTGTELYERRFARDFAKYNGVKYCVPTTSGTSSLTLALLGLGVRPDDEVLVPGNTWVACASSVMAIGAIPILVDIDPDTLCMSLAATKKAITPRTVAIMLVHAFCAVADLDGFVELSKKTRIPLIEDCSQAHGSKWRNKRVGSWGRVGCFSLQQSKVLTCGEGGAAITDDKELYLRMEQLRSDGRLFTDSPKIGRLELYEVGEIQGHNLSMSEFHAAIVFDRLKHLNRENKLREKNADYLRKLLSQIKGLKMLTRYPQVTELTYYNFAVKVDLKEFGGNSIDAISNALMEELKVLVHPIYQPMNNHILYNPLRSPRAPKSPEKRKLLDPKRFKLPMATEARRTCLTFLNLVLLGNKQDMRDIAEAFKKVKILSSDLLQIPQKPSKEAF